MNSRIVRSLYNGDSLIDNRNIFKAKYDISKDELSKMLEDYLTNETEELFCLTQILLYENIDTGTEFNISNFHMIEIIIKTLYIYITLHMFHNFFK